MSPLPEEQFIPLDGLTENGPWKVRVVKNQARLRVEVFIERPLSDGTVEVCQFGGALTVHRMDPGQEPDPEKHGMIFSPLAWDAFKAVLLVDDDG